MSIPPCVVTRLRELLLARMKHNSLSSLSEVLNARGGFSEPDAELVGHLIRYRRELASWMRTALEHSSTGKGWDGNPNAFLRGHLVSWLQEKKQFFRADEGAARQLDALYERAILETSQVLASPTDEAKAADGLRGVWEAHRERLVMFVGARLWAKARETPSAPDTRPRCS